MQDSAARAVAQKQLASEAALLERVYTTHLYGGPTLPDSVADGCHDSSSGALFRSSTHADLLFREDGCLRTDADNCAPQSSPWYAVTHGGIDPMMQRLVEEATLLTRDNASTIAPDASNTRCVIGCSTWRRSASDMPLPESCNAPCRLSSHAPFPAHNHGRLLP